MYVLIVCCFTTTSTQKMFNVSNVRLYMLWSFCITNLFTVRIFVILWMHHVYLCSISILFVFYEGQHLVCCIVSCTKVNIKQSDQYLRHWDSLVKKNLNTETFFSLIIFIRCFIGIINMVFYSIYSEKHYCKIATEVNLTMLSVPLYYKVEIPPAKHLSV